MYQCTFYMSNTDVGTLYTLPHIFTKIPWGWCHSPHFTDSEVDTHRLSNSGHLASQRQSRLLHHRETTMCSRNRYFSMKSLFPGIKLSSSWTQQEASPISLHGRKPPYPQSPSAHSEIPFHIMFQLQQRGNLKIKMAKASQEKNSSKNLCNLLRFLVTHGKCDRFPGCLLVFGIVTLRSQFQIVIFWPTEALNSTS